MEPPCLMQLVWKERNFHFRDTKRSLEQLKSSLVCTLFELSGLGDLHIILPFLSFKTPFILILCNCFLYFVFIFVNMK